MHLIHSVSDIACCHGTVSDDFDLHSSLCVYCEQLQFSAKLQQNFSKTAKVVDRTVGPPSVISGVILATRMPIAASPHAPATDAP
jgi:hypothetical protein